MSDAATRRGFIAVKFQEGPVPDGVNGCHIEDVIDVAVERLALFQRADLACRENDMAMFHLEKAKAYLEARRTKRVKQGVEGTMRPHDPGGD